MKSVLSHIRSIKGTRKDPPLLLPETAFHIYFLAQHQGLHQEAVQAARATLYLPMVIEDLGDKLEFSSSMTGTYLYELWKYHEHIRSELKSGVPNFRSRLPEGVKALRCKFSYYIDNSLPWLDNYVESIAGAPHLFNFVEFEDAWARHIKEFQAIYKRMCPCIEISSELRRAFWDALTAFVDDVIEMVRMTSD